MPDRTADGALAPSALLDAAHGTERARDLAAEDQDTGDIPFGVDEDELNSDDLDTDKVATDGIAGRD